MTTFKTLSARIRGAKTELEELGEEEDEYTKTTAKLRNLVKSLTGFDIMVDDENFKDIYEILVGIGKEWDNLTDVEQASLGEALAGKRNSNALYAVLQNYEQLEAVYKTSTESQNSAMKEQENYAKSIQYSINRIKATAQDLVATLLESDSVKSIIDSANTGLEGLSEIVENLAEPLSKIMELIGKILEALGKFSGAGNGIPLLATLLSGSIWLKSNKVQGLSVWDFILNTDKKQNSKSIAKNIISQITPVIEEVTDETEDVVGNAINEVLGIQNKELNKSIPIVNNAKIAWTSLSGVWTKAAASLGLTAGGLGIAVAAIGVAVYAGVKAFDKWNVTVKETQEKINGLNGKISELNSEIDNLKDKGHLNSEELKRLDFLESELQIQEKLLEIEEKRNALELTQSNDIGDLFDGDNLETILRSEQTSTTGESFRNISAKYTKLMNDIEYFEKTRDNLNPEFSTDYDLKYDALTQKIRDAKQEQLELSSIMMDKAVQYLDYYNQAMDASTKLSGEEKAHAEDLANEYKALYDDFYEKATNIQKAMGTFDYTSTINNIFGNAEFDKLGIKEELIDVVKAGGDITSVINKYKTFKKELDAAGISANALYNYLLNIEDPNRATSESILEKYGLDEFGRKDKGYQYDKRRQNQYNQLKELGWLNDFGTLTDEALELDAEMKTKYPDANVNKFEDWLYFMQETAKKEPIEIEVKFDTKGFDEVDNNLEEVHSLYEKFYNDNAKYSTVKTPLDISDVEKLREVFGKIDGFDFDEWELKVTSKDIEVDEIKQAFNEISSAYATNMINMQGATKETMAMIRSQLENSGYTSESSDEFTQAQMARVKASELITQAQANGNVATQEMIDTYFDEGQQLGITTDKLYDYLYEAMLAGDVTISGDYSWLEKLSEALDIPIAKLRGLLGLANQGSGIVVDDNGTIHSTYGGEKGNNYIKQQRAQDKAKANDEKNGLTHSAPKPSGGGGSDKDPYVDAFEKELKHLQELRDAGIIDEKEYLDKLKALYIKYFANKKQYYEQFKKYEREYLEGMKSLYSSAISGAISLLNFQKNKLEKQRDNEIKQLEKEKEAAMDAIQSQIDSLEDQKEAMEKANETRERAINLQKDQYNLERMMSQRTRLTYKNGQMVYSNDTSEVRDAKEQVRQDLFDMEIAKIDDQIDDLNKQLEDVEKYYDDLIESTNEFYDAQLEGLQNMIDMWEEFQTKMELADALKSLNMLGVSMDDILSGNMDAFNSITQGYAACVAGIEGNSEQIAQALGVSQSTVDGWTKGLLGYSDELNNFLGSINPESLLGVNDALNGVGEAASNAASAISGGGGGTTTSSATGTSEGGKAQSGSPQESSTEGGNSIKDALDEINDPESLNKITAAFVGGEDDEGGGLLGAVKQVTQAIAGGGDEEGEGGGSNEEGGDPSTLSGSIEFVKTTAEEVIPNIVTLFAELQAQIMACVDAVNSLAEALASLGDIEGGGNSFSFGGGGSSRLSGTAYASGKWNNGKDEVALLAEEGQEIIAHRDGTFDIVGEHGATFGNVKHDDVVFDAQQTKMLLKKGRINSRGKAYAGGKDNIIPLSSNEISKFNVLGKLNDLTEKLEFGNQKLITIDRNVDTISHSQITNNNSNTVMNIENTFTCNGVSLADIQAELSRAFEGIFSKAYQQSMMK